MNTDHLAYKRAVGVSLIGLALQLTAGIVLLLYTLFGGDPYALPAAYAVLLGVPIWVLLALVLHQHKLERLEALEAEAFAQSEASAASVFEEAGADEVVHARRLAWMHVWLLPSASVVVGAAYIAVGAWAYLSSGDLADTFNASADATRPDQGGVGLAIAGIAALTSFVFARYVAGMAKERVWMLLHAGAGAAVGVTLSAALVAVAHFLDAVGSSVLLQYLPAVLGVFMIALGGEIFLNFLLNLYRPRGSADYLRPPFDSRVLAYVAAPDRLAQSISDAINYQFGFSVSSTWFYRLISRWVVVLILVLVGVSWLMSGLVIVRPDERGILIQSGVAAETAIEPGLVVKAPWPFDRLVTFPASSLNEVLIGTEAVADDQAIGEDSALWTDADLEGETMFIVNPAAGRETAGIEGGQSLAVLTGGVRVQYTIDDVLAYFNIAQDGGREGLDAIRADIIEALAASAVTEVLAQVRVGDLLGSDQETVTARIAQAVQQEFDRIDSGVRVVGVGLESVAPPADAAASFEQVWGETIGRVSTVQQARSEAEARLAQVAGNAEDARAIVAALDELESLRTSLNTARDTDPDSEATAELAEELDATRQRITELIVDAGGQAAEQLARARSDRWERAFGARADAERFAGRRALFEAAPAAFRVRTLLAALSQLASGRRVYILPTGPEVDIQIDQTEIQTGLDLGRTTPSDEEN